jgi:hypothetical protein
MVWKMWFSWVKPPLIRCVGEGFDIHRQGTSYKSGHVPSMLISLLVKSLKSLRLVVFCVFVWLAISDSERQTCYKTETMNHGYPKKAISSP